MDKVFKAIMTELFREYLGLESVSIETGVMLREFRVDVLIADLKLEKELPEGSWLKFVAENSGKYTILEFKHLGSTLNYNSVAQALTYKLTLMMDKHVRMRDVSAILIVSKVTNYAESNIKNWLSRDYHISGSGAFYRVKGMEAFDIPVIVVDELDPSIEYNEILALFSSSRDKSLLAAKRIISKYSPKTFIYIFAILYKPEVARMARIQLSPEKIRMAVEVIGIHKIIDAVNISELAKAIGPEKLVELISAVGISELAKAIGPEKLVELIKQMVESLPEDKKQELIKSLLKSNTNVEH